MSFESGGTINFTDDAPKLNYVVQSSLERLEADSKVKQVNFYKTQNYF